MKYFIIFVRNYLFLKIYATSEGAVSHNVLNYQQLSNARYQVGQLMFVLSNYQTCTFPLKNVVAFGDIAENLEPLCHARRILLDTPSEKHFMKKRFPDWNVG